jgi:hypothetical protein
MALAAVIFAATITVYAAEGFNGKWKGEMPNPLAGRGGQGQGAPPDGPAPGGGAGGGGGFGGGGGRGGGGRGGGGGFGGPGGGGFGGPGGGGFGREAQKITLNIKTKEDKKSGEVKATGNITIGETTDDIKDGKIEGNKITFTAGRAPAPIYSYSGELSGDEIKLTRSAGGRGGGQQFTLKR